MLTSSHMLQCSEIAVYFLVTTGSIRHRLSSNGLNPPIRRMRNSSYSYRGLIVILAITLFCCLYRSFDPRFAIGNWAKRMNGQFEWDNSSLDCGYLIRSHSLGRLGNQMFIYASFYGIVRKQRAGKKAFFQVNHVPSMLDDAFEGLSIPRGITADAGVEHNGVQYVDEHNGCCTYDPVGIETLTCDGKHVYISGWRQSYKYFDHVKDDVKKEFTFKVEIREQCHRLMEDSLTDQGLHRNECVIIGAHLRRGDFAKPGKIEFGHTPASEDYLLRSIRFYETKFYEQNTTCVAFMVFGDDYEWNVKASQNVHLLEPNSTRIIQIDHRTSTPSMDMCMMSLCDHVIITTGTYSWWAGFFSRGMVVRQKEFARNGSVHASEYKVDDYFPPSWIPL